MPSVQASTGDRGARRNAAVLVTGAAGEVGYGLLSAMHAAGRRDLVAIDLRGVDDRQRALCRECIVGDVCEIPLLQRLHSMFEVSAIYHLAALLSTRTEFAPEAGHAVNVDGTMNMLRLAADQARSHGMPVTFLFPSSLAVYGLPDADTRLAAGAVTEDQFNRPTTMYGCNKLYCELLGAHLQRSTGRPDFRSIRFPGLISADTQPTGGTTDYAPEMIHAAAQGQRYDCFVLRDTRLPFMTMPDAVEALIKLGLAEPQRLTTRAYNIRGFSASAAEIRSEVLKHFPAAVIGFEPDPSRQVLVDSWPGDVDDSRAQKDWGFDPRHGLANAMSDYLVPAMKKRYPATTKP